MKIDMIPKAMIQKLNKMVGHGEGRGESEVKEGKESAKDKAADMKIKLRNYRQNKLSFKK